MINAERIILALDRHLDHRVDLILTKMMRGNDAQDMEDVAFLVRTDRILPAQLEGALDAAVIPDIDELRQAFEQAKPKVRELVRAATF